MRIDKYYDKSTVEGQKGNAEQQSPEPKYSENDQSGIPVKKILESIYNNRFGLIALVIIILAINVVLRAGLLKYQGLFEPDGFFYYSVIREMVNNHMLFGPHTLSISGFPFHNPIGEAPGLLSVATIPYYLFGFMGLSYYTIMRWMPIVFGVLEAIVAYFLVKKLSNSRALGLLAMVLLSISSGNIARTAGTVYRGDSFISLFLMLALLFMLRAYSSKERKWLYINAIISEVFLSLGSVIWNGSPFIIIIYLVTLVLVLVYAFARADTELLFKNTILSAGLLLVYILEFLYVSAHIANLGILFGPSHAGMYDAIIFYVPVIVANIALYYATKRSIFSKSVFSYGLKRAAVSIFVLIIALLVIFIFFRFEITRLTSGISVTPPPVVNSTSPTYVPIGETTQELQPPSYGFLYSSFNLQLGFGLLIGYLFNWVNYINRATVFVILLFAFVSILMYILFEHRVSGKQEDFRIGNIPMNVNPAILAFISYAFVTMYLQSGAIRYNALVSIPLTMCAAYLLYLPSKALYDKKVRNLPIILITTIVLAALIIYLLVKVFYPVLHYGFGAVVAAAVLIFITFIALLIYLIYASVRKILKPRYVALALILVIIFYNFYSTYVQSYTAVQADGINPQFLQAMTWLKNNTASNATVLALWPDGSVVEGWGNRTSYMDSVGGENGTKVYYFSKYLFNTSLDTQYLYGINRPQYLIARNFWYAELGGIAQEGLVTNATDYGYITLTSLNSTHNGTATFFIFSSDVPPYYTAELVSIPQQNSTTVGYKAYIGIRNSTRFTLMRSIIFFNSTSSGYTTYTIGNESNSANYTLMVLFSGHVINGAYILGPKLIQSNLFKFTFLCNSFSCPYNDSNATMSVVYVNSDTRILKITYLR